MITLCAAVNAKDGKISALRAPLPYGQGFAQPVPDWTFYVAPAVISCICQRNRCPTVDE